MAYFEDLTPYEYCGYFEGIKNVGWLDGKFPQAPQSKEFIEKLREYTQREFLTSMTRGFHLCPYCQNTEQGRKMGASSSCEIRVVGQNGEVYASPYLILHYVEEHNYNPPQEFFEAVMHGPRPGSEKHNQALKNSKKTYNREKAEEKLERKRSQIPTNKFVGLQDT